MKTDWIVKTGPVRSMEAVLLLLSLLASISMSCASAPQAAHANSKCKPFTPDESTRLRGSVAGVSTRVDLIVLDIGRQDGLRVGEELELERNGMGVGNVVVERVYPARSAARCLGRGTPAAGDEALSRRRRDVDREGRILGPGEGVPEFIRASVGEELDGVYCWKGVCPVCGTEMSWLREFKSDAGWSAPKIVVREAGLFTKLREKHLGKCAHHECRERWIVSRKWGRNCRTGYPTLAETIAQDYEYSGFLAYLDVNAPDDLRLLFRGAEACETAHATGQEEFMDVFLELLAIAKEGRICEGSVRYDVWRKKARKILE